MAKKTENDVELNKFMIFLLSGEDSFSIEMKTGEIISAFMDNDLKDFNYSHFNAENMSAELIGSALYSLPVMSVKRIVLISDIDTVNIDIYDMLSRFLKKKIDTTVLVLTGTKPDKRKTFFKEITSDKRALCLEFKEKNEREIMHWVKNYISSKGCSISMEGLQMLSLTLSSNLSQVASEADKLIEYSKGKTITDDIVEKVLGISKEYNIFRLQNCVAEKDLKRSLVICDNIMKNKNNKTDPIAINLFLSRVFTSAFEVGYQAVTGKVPVDKAAYEAGYNNAWKDADIITCAKKYKVTELIRCQRYFLECDIKLKSGYQDPRTAIITLLEKLILHSDNRECGYLTFFNEIRK
ncbi:MAG TPA: DNA polymerase III subunit delta [Clostridiales bacterium]|nr:DNA polymerase III subunit delta [Clostridiales bacterium]HQP69448.1 DNA polymerase III subunit delta [Clostridiales bacterium]